MDIPHIQTHLDADSSEGNREFSINIFPSQSVLNKAILDVMKFLNWTRCAIIYEQDAGECDDKIPNYLRIDSFSFTPLGVIKLRDLLSFSPLDVLVKTADQKSFHAILQEMKDKEIYNMIIDIHDRENMSEFLKAVSEEIDLLQSQRAWTSKIGKHKFILPIYFISLSHSLPLDQTESRAADE